MVFWGSCVRSVIRVKRKTGLTAAIVVLGTVMAYALPPQRTESGTGELGRTSATFEVASVRAVSSDHHGVTSISPWDSDLFVARNASLRLLIGLAYGMDSQNIDGLADKLGSRLFDVEARVDGQQKLTYEQMQPLLENLLRDRFHLAVHRVMRQEKGYALVVAKSGDKLKPSETSATRTSGASWILPNGLRGTGLTMETLAGMLSRPLGSPVEDQTGLRGSYDVTLQYRTMNSDDSSLPSVFTALQEQLGLKVIQAKVPVQVLIVDHVDAEPTAQ